MPNALNSKGCDIRLLSLRASHDQLVVAREVPVPNDELTWLVIFHVDFQVLIVEIPRHREVGHAHVAVTAEYHSLAMLVRPTVRVVVRLPRIAIEHVEFS
jgi:hypothetical protein